MNKINIDELKFSSFYFKAFEFLRLGCEARGTRDVNPKFIQFSYFLFLKP